MDQQIPTPDQHMPQTPSVIPITPTAQMYPTPPSAPEISTPSSEIRYAGFWIRYAAASIDSIILSIVNIVVAVAVLVFTGGVSDGNNTVAFNLVYYPIALTFNYAYFVILTRRMGSTLGKRALDLKVVASDYGEAGWKKIIIREVPGKLISALPLLIGYIWTGFDKKKQAFHDKIAGTFVIAEKPLTTIKKVVIILIIIFPLLMAVIGIIVAIALVLINPKERLTQAQNDGIRTDIAQITTGLENYATDNDGAYPQSLDQLIEDDYLKKLPEKAYSGDYIYTLCGKDHAIVYGQLPNTEKQLEKYYVFDSGQKTGQTLRVTNEVPTCEDIKSSNSKTVTPIEPI